MKKKKYITIFGITIVTIFLLYFFVLFADIMLLEYVKSNNTKTENEYFLSHAIMLAKQNIDTTQEHARDTSQKVQIINEQIYFLDENNLYCYLGESFEKKTLIENEVIRFLVYGKKLYYVKGLSQEGGILFECEIDGKNPKKIMNNVTDFTVEENVILYVQSFSNGDKHKIIEYHKNTRDKQIIETLGNYSNYAGRKIIFFNNNIIITGNDAIAVFERKSKKYKVLQDDLFECSVATFVFEDNCYVSIIFYDGDYDLPIPPINREKTGIWKFDFKQNKLVQVSKKYARYAEIIGGELILYNEFTFSPFLVKKYLILFHPELIYEKDSGL